MQQASSSGSVEIVLDRLQTNAGDPENVKQCFGALAQFCRRAPTSVYKNVIVKTMEAMEHHRQYIPVLTAGLDVLVVDHFSTLVVDPSSSDGVDVLRKEYDKEICSVFYERGLAPWLVGLMDQYPHDFNLHLRALWLVKRMTHTYMDDQGVVRKDVASNFLQCNLLETAANAIRRFMIHYELCELGTGIIYWFMCSNVPEATERFVTPSLVVAIESAVKTHKEKNNVKKLELRGNNRLQKEILSYPEVQKALKENFIAGTIYLANENHRLNSEDIPLQASEIMNAIVVRQQHELVKKMACFGCDKRLSEKEGLIGTCCRQVIYCSKECQRTHWKEAHKRECTRNKN